MSKAYPRPCLARWLAFLACLVLATPGLAWAGATEGRPFLPDLSTTAPSLDHLVPPEPSAVSNEGSTPPVDRDRVLDLATFLDLALGYNPSTRESWANAKAAAASVGRATGSFYPQANLTVLGERTRTGSGFFEGNNAYDSEYGPTMTLTYLLLDMGGRDATLNQARKSLDAANLTFNQAILDLLLKVQEAYYNYHSSLQTIEARQADLDSSQASLDEARARQEVGLATKSDVLQAQANQAQAKYNLESAVGDARTKWIGLALLTGLSHEPRLKVAEPPTVDTSLVKEQVDSLLKTALDARPDLNALRANVEANQEAVKAADSKLWPTVDVGVEMSRTNHTDDTANEYENIAFLKLKYDFFTGFSDSYAKRKAVAEVAAQRGKLATQRLSVSNTLLSEYQNYYTAVEQVRYGQAYLEQAQESYDLALAKYHEGLGTFVEVVTALSKLSDARSQIVTARTKAYVSVARVAHACGAFEKLGGAEAAWGKEAKGK